MSTTTFAATLASYSQIETDGLHKEHAMGTHNTGITTSTEERALQLLGSGLPSETVASALGITPSRISQLMSDPEFSAQVTALRFTALAKHNERDGEYDDLEDTLLEKLKSSLPLMHRPMEILKAIAVVNGAKRRGVDAIDSGTQHSTVVNLVLPTQLIQQFTTNAANQVVQAGEQQLLTIQSGTLLSATQNRLESLKALTKVKEALHGTSYTVGNTGTSGGS